MNLRNLLYVIIKNGENLGVIGLNGAGKSTLLRLIANVVKPTQGILTHDESIAYMSTNNCIYDELTVNENINFYKCLYNTSECKRDQIINDLELTELLNKYVNTLSSGQKKIVSLACSVLKESSFLLLDEPFVTIDIDNKNKIIAFLKGLKNITLVIASHNTKDIERLCENVCILKDGKVAKFGEINKIYDDASLRNDESIVKVKRKQLDKSEITMKYNKNEEYAFISTKDNNMQLQDLLAELVTKKVTVLEVTKTVKDLEDAILTSYSGGVDKK